MAKKNENRSDITLKCTKCGEVRIRTQKNRINTPERLEINKYCSKCRTHTPHKESKSA